MIAPVEATMAVIGLRTVISKAVERVTKAKLAEVDKLPKTVERMAREVVRGEFEAPFYSDLNYRATMHDLAEGIDIQQVQEMADKFPAEYRDLGVALSAAAAHVIQTLSDMVPRSFYETVTGAKSLQPSDVAIWKFVSILEVLDDPLLIFPLMNTGALLKSQARAVRELYPTFSAAVDAALYVATVKAKAEKKSFELGPRAEVGVRAWAATKVPETPQDAATMAKLNGQHRSRLLASQEVVKKSKEDQAQRKAEAQASKKGAPAELTQAQRDPARPG